MDPTIATLASSIMTQLKAQIGASFDTWTAADQLLVLQCAEDAAQLAVEAGSALATDAEAQASIVKDKAQITAQVANLAAAGQVSLADFFWSAVGTVLGNAAAIAIKAI